LAKCKLDHVCELELVRMEHAYKVQGLRARIETLTILARVNNEHQGLSARDVFEDICGNSGGQG
jgi:hypothetical protein